MAVPKKSTRRKANGLKAPERALRVGIDIGGTFTDFCVFDGASGSTLHHKVPSSPANPDHATMSGLLEFLTSAKIATSDLTFVGLGTTVATNTLLQRSGARTAIVTTSGFRDLIEIGRQTRPSVFDLRKVRPAPLVPRYLRLTVAERVSHTGEIINVPSRQDIANMIEKLRVLPIESVAVCLLNSYTNPSNERKLAGAILRLFLICMYAGLTRLRANTGNTNVSCPRSSMLTLHPGCLGTSRIFKENSGCWLRKDALCYEFRGRNFAARARGTSSDRNFVFGTQRRSQRSNFTSHTTWA